MEIGFPGKVLVGTDVVANIRRWNIREVGQTQDVTVGGGTGVVQLQPTLVTVSTSVEAFATDPDAAQAALRPGAVVTLQFRRKGDGSGNPQQQITGAVVTGVDWGWQPSQHNEVTFATEGGTVDNTAQA